MPERPPAQAVVRGWITTALRAISCRLVSGIRRLWEQIESELIGSFLVWVGDLSDVTFLDVIQKQTDIDRNNLYDSWDTIRVLRIL